MFIVLWTEQQILSSTIGRTSKCYLLWKTQNELLIFDHLGQLRLLSQMFYIFGSATCSAVFYNCISVYFLIFTLFVSLISADWTGTDQRPSQHSMISPSKPTYTLTMHLKTPGGVRSVILTNTQRTLCKSSERFTGKNLAH